MKVLSYIIKFLHLAVVLASAGLVIYITHETFNGISFLSDDRYLTFQFWACILFLVDIVVEFIVAPKKLKYVVSHLFFILISIPYLNIIHALDVHLTREMAYLLHFIPMIRAGYVLAVITGVFTFNDRVKGMFIVYVLIMASSIYFCSLVFYIEERMVNPSITNFWMALWWAILDATTVGSSVNSYTSTGQALDVILSAEGLILFPLFTVYVTNILSRGKDLNLDDDSHKTDSASTTTSSTAGTAAPNESATPAPQAQTTA